MRVIAMSVLDEVIADMLEYQERVECSFDKLSIHEWGVEKHRERMRERPRRGRRERAQGLRAGAGHGRAGAR